MNISDHWVLLWSPESDAFHRETLGEYMHANRRACETGRAGAPELKWTLIGVYETAEEQEQAFKAFRKIRQVRQDSADQRE